MDERTIKRLLLVLVSSIVVVMLIKMGLTRTYSALNKVAADKKPAPAASAVAPQAALAPASGVAEAPVASAVADAPSADTYAASGVDGAK